VANDNRGDEGLMLVFVLVAIVWGGSWLLWHNFREPIAQGMIWLRQGEMALASLWTRDDTVVQVPLSGNPPAGQQVQRNKDGKWLYDARFVDVHNFVKNAKPSAISDNQVAIITKGGVDPLKYFFGAGFALMFLWCVFRGPTSFFRRNLNLEGLLGQQAKVFPVVQPFTAFDPRKLPARPLGAEVPDELAPFSEALSPEEWIVFNHIPLHDNMPDPDKAEAAFIKQLGPRWKGAMALPPELQVLLAAFCLKAARKRDESDAILSRLALCWDDKSGLKLSRDRGLVSLARKTLKNKSLSETTLANCNRHAYVATALLRALNTSREEGGVLASAQFVWLRAHNRALWYPLNNLGRQAFHIEALGAMAHYRAEKQINRPIPKPRVMPAVEALTTHLKNPILARPIPLRAKSSGKSRAA